MAKMEQTGTDYGTRGESGEKEPKSAQSADTSGEKREGIKNGVGMGKADRTGLMEHGVGRSGVGQPEGRTGEFNTGSAEKDCYNHKRYTHAQG